MHSVDAFSATADEPNDTAFRVMNNTILGLLIFSIVCGISRFLLKNLSYAT
jgi:hypothetical protein